MQLFYHPELTADLSTIRFDKEESKHIVRVLRKKEGDALMLTNGKGLLCTAVIGLADLKHCEATVQEMKHKEPLPYQLHMAVAPTKMNDRYEWFFEKATEIGVSEITPLICDHSERKVVKRDRFEKILQSAMKQSLQTYLPILNEPLSFKDLISKDYNEQKFIAHCDEGERFDLSQRIQPKTKTLILIGPEGDFSSEEIMLAKQNDFSPVTLGNHRLRTETAAIVACHTVALCNQGK